MYMYCTYCKPYCIPLNGVLRILFFYGRNIFGIQVMMTSKEFANNVCIRLMVHMGFFDLMLLVNVMSVGVMTLTPWILPMPVYQVR